MPFTFSQFHIDDSQCGQKVSTDSVLLGSWLQVVDEGRALDIGCGCGLLALMLAQRSEKLAICGVEIDADATAQAKSNVRNSPFASRIRIYQQDIRQLQATRFDLIVCNPPYYQHSPASEDAKRQQARRADSLTFGELAQSVERLLSPYGIFALVLPYSEADNAAQQFTAQGLQLTRRCLVKASEHKDWRLVLMQWQRNSALSAPLPAEPETLVLHDAGGGYSAAFKQLTADFYLRLA